MVKMNRIENSMRQDWSSMRVAEILVNNLKKSI